MTRVFNNTEFTEIDVFVSGESLPGILVHDLDDVNCDGDFVVCSGVPLPENEEDAEILLKNETGIPLPI